MMDFGNFLASFPSRVIFSNGTYSLEIDFGYVDRILDYVSTDLLRLRKGVFLYADFRVVFMALVYIRLYPSMDYSEMAKRGFAAGFIPGVDKIVNLLPLGGCVNLSGTASVIEFKWKELDKLWIEQQIAATTLNRAISNINDRLNYDSIRLVQIQNILQPSSITYSHFISKSCDVKNNTLLLKSNSVMGSMNLSVCACVLFLTGATFVGNIGLRDWEIMFGTKLEYSLQPGDVVSIIKLCLLYLFKDVPMPFSRNPRSPSSTVSQSSGNSDTVGQNITISEKLEIQKIMVQYTNLYKALCKRVRNVIPKKRMHVPILI